jgi:hypothetical protein
MNNEEIIAAITRSHSDAIPRIFQENLLFSFVCGGWAKGYATAEHDVDVFICTKREVGPEVEQEYLRWYFALHNDLHLPPDTGYPGEVVSVDALRSSLDLLEVWKFSFHVADIATKKAIIWADMLSGAYLDPIGPRLDLLAGFHDECVNYPNRWKDSAIQLMDEKDRKVWEQQPPLLIMERFMRHPKFDRRVLNPADFS